MENLLYIALPVLFVVGVCIGFVAQRVISTRRVGDAEVLAKRIVEEARKEAQAQKKEILLQGQDDLYNQKKELENEFREREREMKSRERKLDELGERLEEKNEKATEKERDLLKLEKELSKQIFPQNDVKIYIIEKFELSEQYTPENLFEAYKDSIYEEINAKSAIYCKKII